MDKMVEAAKAYRDGRIDELTVARTVTSLSLESEDPDDEIFTPFRAFDSETDHFPGGEMRKLCASEYLERADIELKYYAQQAAPDLRKACEELIARLER